MAVGLGIDTGGTYTDAVVLDRVSGHLLAKGKALTDRSNLARSVLEAVLAVGKEALKADVVALSTTLATNAVVEGRGADVGLIVAGAEIEWPLPPAQVRVVEGGHRINGEAAAALDVEAVKEAARYFQGRVEAVAISTYLSVRNPEHELEAKAIVEGITGVPVVCGHELTTALGFRERTVTAVLNARLIPIIKELLAAVKSALADIGIKAPVMVVRSDGSLVDETEAWMRPIQTLLSGPAASVLGAVFLTGIENGMVVDVGGTTSDVAVVLEGRPTLNREGASVGGWRTRVRAADMTTIGLGGDSYIWRDRDHNLRVGPKRVAPLSWLAYEYPEVLKELELIREDPVFGPTRSEMQDFLILIRENSVQDAGEADVVSALRGGPLSVRALGKALQRDADLLPLDRLEATGVILRAGLTPTDVLHYLERLGVWNRDASRSAMAIMARRMGVDPDTLAQDVLRALEDILSSEILKKAIGDGLGLEDPAYCPVCQGLTREALGPKLMNLLDVTMRLKIPLVGVGAPAQAYLPGVAGRLGAGIMVPEHADVANAVGAIVGNVVETADLLIHSSSDGGYILFSPWLRQEFDVLDEARSFAIDMGTARVRESALRAGASGVEVSVKVRDCMVATATENSLCLGTEISITAVGAPKWFDTPGGGGRGHAGGERVSPGNRVPV